MADAPKKAVTYDTVLQFLTNLHWQKSDTGYYFDVDQMHKELEKRFLDPKEARNIALRYVSVLESVTAGNTAQYYAGIRHVVHDRHGRPFRALLLRNSLTTRLEDKHGLENSIHLDLRENAPMVDEVARLPCWKMESPLGGVRIYASMGEMERFLRSQNKLYMYNFVAENCLGMRNKGLSAPVTDVVANAWLAEKIIERQPRLAKERSNRYRVDGEIAEDRMKDKLRDLPRRHIADDSHGVYKAALVNGTPDTMERTHRGWLEDMRLEAGKKMDAKKSREH